MTSVEEQVFLQAQWGGRQRSPEQLATALGQTLSDFDELGEWSLTGWVNEHDTPLLGPVGRLVQWVAEQFPTRPRADEGALLTTLSRPSPEGDFGFHVVDGATSASPMIVNRASLEPAEGMSNDVLERRGDELMRIIVDRWDPDWSPSPAMRSLTRSSGAIHYAPELLGLAA